MKVFLSYSRRDADFVDELSRRLTLLGYEAWVDREDIIGGGEDRWRRSIVRAIRESDAMVLVLSPNATASENVERELSVAADKDTRVIPVIHKPCELPDGFQYELAGLQYIDFSELEFDEALTQLATQLGPVGADGAESQAGNAPPVVPPPRQPEPGRRKALLIGAGAAACVIGLVALVWALSGGDDDGADAASSDDSDAATFVDSASEQSTDADSESSDSPETDGSLRVMITNGSCSASDCEDTPIEFVIEGVGEGAELTIALTDPSGFPVESADPPTGIDPSTYEWSWTAGYGDPIGTYEVEFATDDGEAVEAFDVDAIDEPFGVVQNLAAAVAEEDWDLAATIDGRFEDDIQKGGETHPAQQYADWVDQHWITSDPVGVPTEQGTQIIGAFVAVNVQGGDTGLFCERWIVFADNTTMRSSGFPTPETQTNITLPGTSEASEVESWVASNCSE